MTMPHARAGSLALHQACVIEAVGVLAAVSGCVLPWNGPGRLALSVSRLRHAPKIPWRGRIRWKEGRPPTVLFPFVGATREPRGRENIFHSFMILQDR